MDMELIDEIKRKRELSKLPDSIVERAAVMGKGDVKESRALLRKYFGVFLTNKVLKGKGDLLKVHMSSKKRDYEKFYGEIFDGLGDVKSVIDLGAGLNGFSYGYLKEVVGDVNYVAVEAAGQEVDHMNKYFFENDFSGRAVCMDLFEVEEIKSLLEVEKRPRFVFLFQVVDALENLERNFSKKFITEISEECEKIVISLPTESLGRRKKFAAQRKWIMDFLKEHFMIEKDFKMNGERVVVISRK